VIIKMMMMVMCDMEMCDMMLLRMMVMIYDDDDKKRL
jgi:hypothetical protein